MLILWNSRFAAPKQETKELNLKAHYAPFLLCQKHLLINKNSSCTRHAKAPKARHEIKDRFEVAS